MINSSILKSNEPCWFVMRCHDAKAMEALVDEYNADGEVSALDKVQDYFIPSLVIGQRTGLAFLFVRPSAFGRMGERHTLQDHSAGRLRLLFYNDNKGEAITVRPEMMRLFILGCLEYRERLEVHAKAADIAEGISVTVRRGAFKDYKAEVYDIRYRAGGIRFSVAIKFFANQGYVHIHDLGPEDVQLTDREMPLFSDDFLDRIQTTLLEILARQVNRKETAESRADDMRQLRQLYYLRHAVVDDPLRAAQFDALMSICASLMGNAQEKSKYNRIVKERLKGLRDGKENENPNENTIAEAYLLTALYISTKDAEYRTRLKAIVMQQLPEHKALRAFLSLVRR